MTPDDVTARAVEVLREHQPQRFGWECICGNCHTYQGDHVDRQATLAAHQADALADAGLLADPPEPDAFSCVCGRINPGLYVKADTDMIAKALAVAARDLALASPNLTPESALALLRDAATALADPDALAPRKDEHR